MKNIAMKNQEGGRKRLFSFGSSPMKNLSGFNAASGGFKKNLQSRKEGKGKYGHNQKKRLRLIPFGRGIVFSPSNLNLKWEEIGIQT